MLNVNSLPKETRTEVVPTIIDSLPKAIGTKVVATICSFLPPNEVDQAIQKVWNEFANEPLVTFERVKAHADPEFNMDNFTPNALGIKRYKNQDPTGETIGKYLEKRQKISNLSLTPEQRECIRSLQLREVKNGESLKSLFSLYPNLESLFVEVWDVKEIPEDFPFQRLKKLSLKDDGFSSVENFQFLRNFYNLTTLHIQSRQLIEHFFPHILFQQLEDLHLSDPNLMDANLRRIQCPNLKKLTLNSNEITASFLATADFGEVEEIVFHGQKLNDEFLSHLSRYKLKRVTIDTDGPMTTSLTGAFLSGLSQDIEEVVINSSSLTDRSLTYLHRYHQLRKLDICFRQYFQRESALTGSFLSEVPVKQLKELSLSGNTIRGEFLLTILERHHHLTSENVCINSVKVFLDWDLSLEDLERLSKTRVLNMQLTCKSSLDLLKNILIWCSQNRNPVLERLEIYFRDESNRNRLIIEQNQDTYSVTTHFSWESVDILFLEDILHHPELQETHLTWNGRDQCLKELERRHQTFSLHDSISRVSAFFENMMNKILQYLCSSR